MGEEYTEDGESKDSKETNETEEIREQSGVTLSLTKGDTACLWFDKLTMTRGRVPRFLRHANIGTTIPRMMATAPRTATVRTSVFCFIR
jgi:hypothetical protein